MEKEHSHEHGHDHSHHDHSHHDHKHDHHKATSSKNKDNEIVTISKVSLWQGIAGVLAVLLVISIITGGFGGGSGIAAPTGNGGSAPTGNAGADTEFYAADDPMKGDPDAPVTIVEFSDFECPFCGRFYSQTYGLIEQNYINTGKANIVFRDFPLSFHQQATPAALAAECADDQGKFWEYHDLIFENQGALSDASYTAWAQQLGLDMNEFDSCYTSRKHLAEVQEDFQEGGALGITGTPGFFVNGRLISGAQPYSVFEAAIEAALNG